MDTPKLGHVHLKVRNLDQAAAFYSRVFDLEETERLGHQYVFLSAGPMHHTVALQAVGASAPAPFPQGVGLYHVAFEVPSRQALAKRLMLLQKEDIQVHIIDHGISWALYFQDPDGNGLEIYCDTREAPNGTATWQGRTKRLAAETLLDFAESSAV